jgi:hypothetical protein
MSFERDTMKNVYEIFAEFEKSASREDQILVLRYNGTYALKTVLRGTFDPGVQFVFDAAPKYKVGDSPPGMSYSSISQELSRAYLFEKNNPRVAPGLSLDRKTQILIQILEVLEAKEAEVFMNMILKKQNVKGLTYEIVKEAFHDLLP